LEYKFSLNYNTKSADAISFIAAKLKEHIINVTVVLLTMIFSHPDLAAQNTSFKVVAGSPVNYDESLGGVYTLPDCGLISLYCSHTGKIMFNDPW